MALRSEDPANRLPLKYVLTTLGAGKVVHQIFSNNSIAADIWAPGLIIDPCCVDMQLTNLFKNKNQCF